MDRNSVIGLLLIGGILIFWSIWSQPSQEEIEAQKQKQDSLMAAQQEHVEDEVEENPEESDTAKVQVTDTTLAELPTDTTSNDSTLAIAGDTLKEKNALQDQFGEFAKAAEGEEKLFTLENEELKVTISSLGGRMVSAELKNYQTHDSLPLYLFTEDSSDFNMSFYDTENRLIDTRDLYFTPIGESVNVTGKDAGKLSMRLYGSSRQRYVEFSYVLTGNNYRMGYQVKVVGREDVLKKNQDVFGLHWSIAALSKEKSIKNERNTTAVYWKYKNGDVEELSEMGSDEEELEATTEWISLKQQYFSTAIYSETGLDKYGGKVTSKEYNEEEEEKYTKHLSMEAGIPFSESDEPTFPATFYLGPNHYQTLKALNIGLEDQINLGWGIFGWVNMYLVIPVFNFLEGFNIGYGIIILLLTIFIKLILFPLTWKSYKSSAKMRVLKPEIDELNEKNKDAEPLKKQQATMALYKQAGVNPMAGCVPMLLQMPILYAMFRFFPSSIELRQESFLWATDLSTYDSIATLPFSIPFYGSHVSLFTLLMAVSTFLYSKFNMQMTASSGPQAAQMKIMLYFMPVFLLCIFNDFAAGLSYYYFTANVISISQQFIIKKWFIDEKAIRQKIQENKKKPKSKKKSGFQKRLEDMAKKREQQMRNRRK